MNAPVAVARGLTKKFGDRLAVDDLSFEVHNGRVTGFLGPNGAGKTTTLRMLLGLATPTSGDATVFGRRYVELENPATTVGVLLDADSFHPRRSARDHLRFMTAATGVREERIDDVLATVALSDAARRRVGEFSLGMRQRLGLAAALLGEPRLLILDEPANGLDPAGIRWLRAFLRSFAQGGGAVFVSSHQLAQVSEMADEVVVIQRGRLVTQTTVEQLTAGAAVTVRVRSPQPDRMIDALVGAGGAVRRRDGEIVRASGLRAEDVGKMAAEAGLVLYELVEETQSLEDVFFKLTEGEGAGAGTD